MRGRRSATVTDGSTTPPHRTEQLRDPLPTTRVANADGALKLGLANGGREGGRGPQARGRRDRDGRSGRRSPGMTARAHRCQVNWRADAAAQTMTVPAGRSRTLARDSALRADPPRPPRRRRPNGAGSSSARPRLADILRVEPGPADPNIAFAAGRRLRHPQLRPGGGRQRRALRPRSRPHAAPRSGRCRQQRRSARRADSPAAEPKTGIYALEDVDLFNLLCLPEGRSRTVRPCSARPSHYAVSAARS